MYLDIAIALFGHSMGVLICFELSQTLRSAELRQPLHLFVSGHQAPRLEVKEALHDAELIVALAQRNSCIRIQILKSRMHSCVAGPGRRPISKPGVRSYRCHWIGSLSPLGVSMTCCRSIWLHFIEPMPRYVAALVIEDGGPMTLKDLHRPGLDPNVELTVGVLSTTVPLRA